MTFQVRGLGQHDIRPGGHLAGHDVHDHQQVERLDGAQGLGLVGQRLQEIGRVDHPPLDRVRGARDRGLPDARRQRLVGEWVLVVRIVDLRFHRLRVRWIGIRRDVHRHRLVETALAPPAAEQCVEQGDGPAALGVVAVPVHVPTRVDQRGRTIPRHFAGGGPDGLGVDPGFDERPFRGVLGEGGGEGLEAEAMPGDIVDVVTLFRHDHVHPRQNQRQVGAGFDRQVVVRLARGDREPRINDNEPGAAADGGGEFLHLRVVHVFAEMRADEHQTLGVGDVGALRRTDVLAEG